MYLTIVALVHLAPIQDVLLHSRVEDPRLLCGIGHAAVHTDRPRVFLHVARDGRNE